MSRYDPDDQQKKAEWEHGRKYILDPLTAPEPSQETGPGSSFVNPFRRSLSVRSKPPEPKQNASTSYPTPPTSASPRRLSFQRASGTEDDLFTVLPSRDKRPTSPLSPLLPLGRSNSVNARSAHPDYTSSTGVNRRRTVHTANPPLTRWNQGTILSRSSDTTSPGPTSPTYPKSPKSPVQAPPTGPENGSGMGKGIQRSASLSSRFPNDMTHRPLDMIRRDVRAADRAPHLRGRKIQLGLTDTIDSLDDTGVGGLAYHHGGPYDATLAARNTNKMYSPVEAVKRSNLEALKATPREYVQDSLVKHVPLQGTATVPPGGQDMSGRTMRYEEGADLMREADAPGGPYKRWDFVQYSPADLKGKGEPSFSADERAKRQEAMLSRHSHRRGVSGPEIEMQPRASGTNSGKDGAGVKVRQRSLSNVVQGSSRDAPPTAVTTQAADSGLGRSNTTGKRFSDGFRRRFGSLRRKKAADEA